MARRLAVAAVLALAATAATALVAHSTRAASAPRTIQVHPGPNAIQRALAGANDGDTLLIHAGTYTGQVVVTDRVTLRGAPGARPRIDGRCGTADTIEIDSPGVVVEHLTVVGADKGFGAFPSAVNFNSVTSGRAQDLTVKDTCDAEYGINVIKGGHQQILDNRVSGFSDSGIYVGSITDTGGRTLRVRGNRTFHNSRGIIIEFSHGVDIRVEDNDMSANTLIGLGESPPAGLLINGSSGVRITRNRAHRNGRYGVDLIAKSHGNRFVGNDFRSNPMNVHAERGSKRNCGSRNHPSAFKPC